MRGFVTRRAAQTALRERLREVSSGQHVAPDTETLATWIERWLEAERTQVRPSTWQSYARNLRVHVVPALGDKRLQHLRPSDFSALYARMLAEARADHARGSGLSPRTVAYVHTIVRKCLQAAVESEGVLASNPAAKVKAPRGSSRAQRHEAVRAWSATELRAFLDRTSHQRHHVAWYLLATTGLRRGEALGMSWGAVDFEAGTVSVRRTLVDVLVVSRFGRIPKRTADAGLCSSMPAPSPSSARTGRRRARSDCR